MTVRRFPGFFDPGTFPVTGNGSECPPQPRMAVRRFQVIFDSDTFPAQSKRPFYHTGFICINDSVRADGTFLSEFSKSKLWVRQVVMNVPVCPQKNFVNPASKSKDRSGISSSKSLRRKQWLAGHAFANAIRESLWSGLNLTVAHCASWVALYGYDASFAESIMRSQSLKMPTEMMVTTVFAEIDIQMPLDQANATIAVWLKKAHRRIAGDVCLQP